MRRSTRALAGLLALALAAGLAWTTWKITRPIPPEPRWLAVAGVLAPVAAPFGVAVRPEGDVLVSTAGALHGIVRVAADGSVTTLAGGERGWRDGPTTEARFSSPSALALAPDGGVIVADTGNHAIRRVSPDGLVTTIAGDGLPGDVDGPGTLARFNGPVGVAVAPDGRIVVADTYNDRIRVIDAGGEVRTLAGGDDGRPGRPRSMGLMDGPGPIARFDTPCGVAVEPSGRIVIADSGNGLVRTIGADGVVSTLALPGVFLERPMAIAVLPAGGLAIADETGRIALVTADGDARVVAGASSGFANDVGESARFRRPSGIAAAATSGDAAPQGLTDRTRLLVADTGNGLVRLLTPDVLEERSLLVRLWDRKPPPLIAPTPVRPPAFDAEGFGRIPLLWPIAPMEGPHEVAGTFGEARGEPGRERFHAGLDVRDVQGTAVRAVRDGVVSSPLSTFGFATLNEGVRIGDLAYIHIRVGRDAGSRRLDTDRFVPAYDERGTLSGLRARRGAAFATGDQVGTINGFNHVHLNIGWPGEEHNPLRFRLVRFVDTIAPTIAVDGVRLFDESGVPLNPDRVVTTGVGRRARSRRQPPTEPVTATGRVHIVVDAWDRAEGNTPARRLGLYSVGYQVLHPDGQPLPGWETPRIQQRFDRMPSDTDGPRLVYASGSGIPVYGAARTRFLYAVTTTYHGADVEAGAWDTRALAPGPYILRVVAADVHGNTATRDVRVTIVHNRAS